jgi:beta-lactamase class A
MRSKVLLLALLAFVAQPAAAATSPSMSGLEQQLSYLVANKSADVGIAAIDLKTGESISIRGDVPFPMASTVKVGVAALYLAQVDHGRRSLDDTIGGVPVRSLMARMIIHSDNRATDILLKDLGGPSALHDWLKDNGVSGLRVDRTIAQLLGDRRDLWDRRDSSTPTAMIRLVVTPASDTMMSPRL